MPSDMQAEQSEQVTTLPTVPQHTKARLPEVSDKRLRVGKKMQAALKAIVWEGQDFAEAAKAAGLTGHAVRCAIAKPHVIRWLKQERQVFLAHAQAQNIHHAVRLRECGNHTAELGAVKVIEQLSDEQSSNPQRVQAPGIVIMIGAAPAQPSSSHKVLDQLTDDSQ